MKVKIVQRFRDKYDRSTLYQVGSVHVFEAERAQDLISRNLAEEIKPEKTDEDLLDEDPVTEENPVVEEPEKVDETPVVEEPEKVDETPVVEEPEKAEEAPVVEEPEKAEDGKPKTKAKK